MGIRTPGKKQNQLCLFDFSLSKVSPEDISVGTPGYLDPFISERKVKRWDISSECFSAAMTLHEMATGVLPTWGEGKNIDPASIRAEMTILPERFDPDLRDRFVRFFEKALRRDHRQRFDNPDEMLKAWSDVFATIDDRKKSRTAHPSEDELEPGGLQRAATQWLLVRLESYFHEGSRVSERKDGFDPAAHGFTAASRPHLVSAQQLAEVVQADPLFLEVAECLEGNSGFSVSALVQRLVEAEAVPTLPRDRYKDGGLRNRQDWEETWRLQRHEDAVEAEVRSQRPEVNEEILKPVIRKAQLEKVGDIPVPPKYGNPDFKNTSFWKLRGKLDVPKERWISYPGAERDGDTSSLIAWAGWNHLQQAQALAEYFLDAKDAHGWPTAKLKPQLAALADLLPWLKQWHNTFDPNYGMGLGDYFQGFLEEQCRALEMTFQEVNAVRFEAAEAVARPPADRRRKGRRIRMSRDRSADMLSADGTATFCRLDSEEGTPDRMSAFRQRAECTRSV